MRLITRSMPPITEVVPPKSAIPLNSMEEALALSMCATPVNMDPETVTSARLRPIPIARPMGHLASLAYYFDCADLS